MPRATEISLAELERLAEEASDVASTTNPDSPCRHFCAALIGHLLYLDPAYATSLAGLLRMPHVLEAYAFFRRPEQVTDCASDALAQGAA